MTSQTAKIHRQAEVRAVRADPSSTESRAVRPADRLTSQSTGYDGRRYVATGRPEHRADRAVRPQSVALGGTS